MTLSCFRHTQMPLMVGASKLVILQVDMLLLCVEQQ